MCVVGSALSGPCWSFRHSYITSLHKFIYLFEPKSLCIWPPLHSSLSQTQTSFKLYAHELEESVTGRGMSFLRPADLFVLSDKVCQFYPRLTGCWNRSSHMSVSLLKWCPHTVIPPKGMPGMSDVSPPVWNLWAVIWFHFAISSLVFLPSSVTLCLIFFCLLVHSCEFFPRKFFNIFR